MNDSHSRLTDQIGRFLFTAVNATPAASFRIILALALPIFFWPLGLKLDQSVHKIPGLPYLYENVLFTPHYLLLILGVLTLFGAGLWPRVMGLSLIVLLLPYKFLSPGQLSRQILLFTLLAFSLTRSDARLSLANWLRPNQPTSTGPIWPIRLIQLQLSAVYLFNALAKTTPEYLSGEVLIGMSQMLPNFLVDLSDGYLHAGPLAIPVGLAAIASTATEYYLALGFWFRRLRIITAVVGVLFHLILMMIIRIHMLDWACMFLYLAFLLPFDRPVINLSDVQSPSQV